MRGSAAALDGALADLGSCEVPQLREVVSGGVVEGYFFVRQAFEFGDELAFASQRAGRSC